MQQRRSAIVATSLCVAAAAVIAILVWQGVTEQGAPDPMRPNTSPTVACLDIGVLVFREGLECILVRGNSNVETCDGGARGWGASDQERLVPLRLAKPGWQLRRRRPRTGSWLQSPNGVAGIFFTRQQPGPSSFRAILAIVIRFICKLPYQIAGCCRSLGVF